MSDNPNKNAAFETRMDEQRVFINGLGWMTDEKAREYLMRDVIAELKRLENPDDPYDGYAHAIILIRDGVMKHE